MRARKTTFPALTLLLDETDGRDLCDVLTSQLIQLKGGRLGSGTSIDDQIRFCESAITELKNFLGVEGEI